MHRSMMIISAFMAVTTGLIILYPSPDEAPTPAGPAAWTEGAGVALGVEVARAAPQPLTLTPLVDDGTPAPDAEPFMADIRPNVRPARLVAPASPRPAPDARAATAATPAATPPLAAAFPEAAPDLATLSPLFAGLADGHPRLLTTTARGFDGALLPFPETLPAPEDAAHADIRAQLLAAPTRAMHTVRLGDSLVTLALRYYGDAEKAELIRAANRRLLTGDAALSIGQILRIPDVEAL